MTLEFRRYRKGDEARIIELFQRSFGRALPPAFWEWRFRDNPAGPELIELAWDGDVLAAHYAVCPVIVDVGGEPRRTALSMTTMTHPDYRGRGIFTTLAERLYARMGASGHAMVWGFPNTLSHRGFVRDLGWSDVSEIPTLRARVGAVRLPSGPPVGEVGPITADDPRLDRLWMRASPPEGVAVRKDARYVAWRLGQHPDRPYSLLGLDRDGELAGWIAFKNYGRAQMDIVDLVVGGDPAAARDLVAAAAGEARTRGVDIVNLWLSTRNPAHHELEKMGFAPGEPVTYLGARKLDPDLGTDVTDVRRWQYSMSDSDVY